MKDNEEKHILRILNFLQISSLLSHVSLSGTGEVKGSRVGELRIVNVG